MSDGDGLRDFFAAQAMLVVMSETQETRIASLYEWLKSLAVVFLHMSFLHVKYELVPDVYEEAAKRAYAFADAMIAERVKVDICA